MVWTPPPKNPIWHIRGVDATLCGRRIGRCYIAGPSNPVSCPKCKRLALQSAPAKVEGQL